MLRKTLILTFIVVVASVSGGILDRILCYVNKCSDDWILEPVAALAVVVIPCYSIITLSIVFASAVALQKRFSTLLSAAIPAGTLSLFLLALFYAPEGDDFTGLVGLFTWLAAPWFVCNIVGLRLWPKDDKANLNGDIND
jgi:hypothetical protein